MENEKNQNNEFNDPVPNLNQQDKIIAAINKNDLSYLGHLYVDVEPDERADFIDAMSRGESTPNVILQRCSGKLLHQSIVHLSQMIKWMRFLMG